MTSRPSQSFTDEPGHKSSGTSPLSPVPAADRLRVTAETGILVALSLALGQFRLFELPAGGSLSLGSLPLLLLAARQGWRRGITAGVLAGLLITLRRPTIVHPIQYLLDYPLAHAVLGMSGLWRWTHAGKAAAAVTFASSLRLLCHVTAGAVFFASPGVSPGSAIATSVVYNLGHMLPETVVNAALAAWLASRHPRLVGNLPAGVRG
ncbi:energy-coupled thiamine transporter ThiT [Candidatus Ozemobacteraceae bacterium]|nr:energy-coupled thiamine transporter ThiT [Candidatus Ozemobacteraceae bacterium]